jgi:hypothetical protein
MFYTYYIYFQPLTYSFLTVWLLHSHNAPQSGHGNLIYTLNPMSRVDYLDPGKL